VTTYPGSGATGPAPGGPGVRGAADGSDGGGPDVVRPDAVGSDAAGSGVAESDVGGPGVGGPGADRPPVSVLNIANVLTVLRLALVPVFVVFMFAGPPEAEGWRYAAFAAYAVAAVTDQIDGSIARRRGLITDFGILVDPIADKALTGAALVSLSILDELPWAVTILIAVREIGVTLLRLWVIRFGVIAASRGGKAKTLLLNVAIGLYVLPLDGIAATGRAAILGMGVVVALATGVDYVYRALALRRRAGRADVGEAPAGAAAGGASQHPGSAEGRSATGPAAVDSAVGPAGGNMTAQDMTAEDMVAGSAAGAAGDGAGLDQEAVGPGTTEKESDAR